MRISQQRQLKYGDFIHIKDDDGWDDTGKVIATDVRGIEVCFKYRPSPLHNIRHRYIYWMFGSYRLNIAAQVI